MDDAEPAAWTGVVHVAAIPAFLSVGVATLSLAACNQSSSTTSEMEALAQTFVVNELGRGQAAAFGPTWAMDAVRASSLLCGEFTLIDGPSGRSLKLRYYFVTKRKTGQIEASSRIFDASHPTAAIVRQSQATFDTFWEKSCEPYRPGSFSY
jgi:hypothetical protein